MWWPWPPRPHRHEHCIDDRRCPLWLRRAGGRWRRRGGGGGGPWWARAFARWTFGWRGARAARALARAAVGGDQEQFVSSTTCDGKALCGVIGRRVRALCDIDRVGFVYKKNSIRNC